MEMSVAQVRERIQRMPEGKQAKRLPVPPPAKPRLNVAMIMYIFPPDYGGRAIQALQVARALRSFGVESFFVAANLSGAPDFEIIDGSPVYRFRTVSLPRLDFLFYMLKVVALLWKKRRNYDLIHFHSIKPFSFLVTALAKLLGKPTLVSLSLVGNDDPEALKRKSFLWAVEAHMYRHLDRINCESTALRDSCLQEGLSQLRLSGIPCGVDEGKFAPPKNALERKRLRRALGLPEDAFICLFVGRVSTRKGCDLLFEAWEQIYTKNEKLYLVLVGPHGEHRFMTEAQRQFEQNVQKYIAAAARHHMKFTGQVEIAEVSKYFRAADCLLFPSRTEGFGIVTIEAMACGLPVIATRIEGVTEDIITHNQDGLILKRREPGELAAAILSLQKDSELYTRLSKNAVAKVQRSYTLSSVAGQHAALYRELVLEKCTNGQK
ncbi:MAG: glycosyltransferase family 1 protein [Calditrichaeota bacterium]|nr:MAG: glycosyltransferase family 1 protein [Calditrichota bacterium]